MGSTWLLRAFPGRRAKLSIKLEGHHHVPFSSAVRKAILRVAAGEADRSSGNQPIEFCVWAKNLRWLRSQRARFGECPCAEISLIGSHGQTIYHQGAPSSFLGHSTNFVHAANWGAERDCRANWGDHHREISGQADMAAGGQGAPLVPFVDYLLYRHPKRNRVALNIGGIANVTVIPAGAKPKDVFAFDTGPGNMVVDALVEKFTHGRSHYDKDSEMAFARMDASETAERNDGASLSSEGASENGWAGAIRASVRRENIRLGQKNRAKPADVVRTATIFTSLSIANAFQKFILPRTQVDELIVSGGGARNPLMMVYLAAILPGIFHRFIRSFRD